MTTYTYDLDLLVKEITLHKAKRVLLHLPDGLKPQAKKIRDEIKKKTKAEVLIWAGSCYGACDIPQGIEKLGVDILFHFGHTAWRRS
jgi:diphthamide biosynthesis enzyme Dph1/Dph2-like protein